MAKITLFAQVIQKLPDVGARGHSVVLPLRNLAISFRTLNIGRFSDGGDESSRKNSNFATVKKYKSSEYGNIHYHTE